MDRANNKIITVSFVVAAILLWLCVRLLIETFAATFGVVARAVDSDVVRHGLSVGAALALFAALQFNSRVRSWAEEVVIELRKVVFPSRKDTMAMTTVVVIMVIISGLIIMTFDFLSGYLVNSIVN